MLISGYRLLYFLTFSVLPGTDELQCLIRPDVVQYCPMPLVPSLFRFLAALPATITHNKMLWNVAWSLCSVGFGSVSVSSDYIFHLFARPECTTMRSTGSYPITPPLFSSFRSLFSLFLVLCTGISDGSVFTSGVARSQHHSINR